MFATILSSCLANPSTEKGNPDAGPTIERVTASTNGFSIDCVPTSVTVTAIVKDPVALRQVDLFHRVEGDQAFRQVRMNASGDGYSATVKATDLPIGAHGIWEFYVAAQDAMGRQGRNPLDRSVQLLLCLGG